MTEKQQKIRSLLALVGACLFQFAILGPFVNSHGVYMAKIKETTDLSMTAIAASTTIRSIAGALLASILAMLFYQKSQKGVMFFSLLSVVIGYVLMIFSTDNVFWYLIPILCAPVSSITVLAVPHVLLRWFPKRSGTAAGFAMAFSGVGGAVFNPVAAALCERLGWQWTIGILGIVSVLVGSVGLFLIFDLKGEPEEAAEDAKTTTFSEGIHAPVWLRFVLVTLTIVFAIVTVMVNNLNIHLEELGFSLTLGASVTSAVMIGNISGKLIFGWVSDRIGIWKSALIISALVCCGTLIFALNRSNIVLMYLGGFVYGLSYFCGTIAISKCSLAAYGSEPAKKYAGYHAGINSAISAIVAFAVGPVFDRIGTFRPVFLFLACLCGTSFLAALGLLILSRRK